jgi:outer membrane protein OmpA-like peptidoglycan-associated protein
LIRRPVAHRFSLVVLATSAAAGAFSIASTADAQRVGWALDRYEPNPAGDVFFAADFPWYNRTRLFAIGLVADYARDPLVLYGSNGDPTRRIVDSQGVLHVQGSLALFDRIGINFSLPISLFQTGEPATPATRPEFNAYGPPVTGDIRLGLRVRIVGQSDRDPISLHIGGHAYLGFIPYNNRDNFVTDEEFRFRAYATLAGHAGPIRWSFPGGFHYRPTHPLLGTSIAPEVYINAAIGFASDDGRLTVGPEAWASYTLNGDAFTRSVSAEAVLGIHYSIADTMLVGVGAGPGISDGAPGTPEFRALLRLAYAPQPRVEPPHPPPPADSDNDNVIDLDDACPHEPMGADPDPDRLGCPLQDADHDGVGNATDLCPNVPAGEHADPQRAGCPAPDTDNDGVFDHEDQCVTTPAGAHPDPERAGCPDADTDNDGVLDHDDQCRTEHSGPHPDASRPGCPLPDRDHDSVPDATDHCPDQPGAPHPDANRNGCPGLVRVEGGQVRILQQVFFATNSDRILPRSYPVLQAVADALHASPDIRRVAIEGHTDNQGDDTRNLQLSDRRANSVMAWLTHHSIDPSRLEAHGYGETRPLASNDTRAGRAQNRRVEFHIVDPAPASAAPATAPSASPATSIAPASSTAPTSPAPATP